MRKSLKLWPMNEQLSRKTSVEKLLSEPSKVQVRPTALKVLANSLSVINAQSKTASFIEVCHLRGFQGCVGVGSFLPRPCAPLIDYSICLRVKQISSSTTANSGEAVFVHLALFGSTGNLP